MVSCLGNAQGENPGGFALLDEDFNVVGRWGLHENGTDDTKAPNPTKNFYDFWYQPQHNIMVSSEWAAPNTFNKGMSIESFPRIYSSDCLTILGFNPLDVVAGRYGHHLHFWNWNERTLLKSIDLGLDGLIPLELRFCHDPLIPCGYVVAALGGSVFRFYKDDAGEWTTEKVISVSALTGLIEGWNPTSALITDMLISLDDRFLYISCWYVRNNNSFRKRYTRISYMYLFRFHGDVRQYYIGDRTEKPRLCGQIWLGGILKKNSDYQSDEITSRLNGGPQMLQLSLDGKRLYVSNSLHTAWDDQFYPDMKTNGSFLAKINCRTDTNEGGMELDQNFFVNFKDEPNGPVRVHEIRYPGGDCTSDIWLS